MSEADSAGAPSRLAVGVAFAAIYLIWGSTYLAIRFAIQTIPPFLMAGTRFILAGGILYGLSRLRGDPQPARIHWRSTAIVGGLMLLGGNGGVVWAEQRVASGLSALLVAMAPVWMVLLEWLQPGGIRPSRRTAVGLVLGLIGVTLLVDPWNLANTRVDLIGAAVLMVSSLCWATGSVCAHRVELPASPFLSTAMEMLAGGVLLLAAGSISGEWTRFRFDAITLESVLAFGYLICFGSLVGFTAYIWLLGVTTLARLSTYAYVNPVVAMFLGWALAGEPVTLQTLLAAAVIVTAVVVIISRGKTRIGDEKISRIEPG